MGQKLQNAKALYTEGIAEGNAEAAIERYTGDRYTQHSTGVADGKEGFLEFFTAFIERNPKREIEIVRGWEDGQYVFVHAYQRLNDGEAEWVTGDFFDTDDQDRMIEHWDVIAAFTGPNPSGHTQVDGPSDITDLDKTEQNKTLVTTMIEHCLFPGATGEQIGSYIAESYIQHNTEVPDGRAHFADLVADPDRPLVYDEVFLCVGQGNFVATLSKARWNDDPVAQVDIFRVEEGLIVEHWDLSEPVPSGDKALNSGKF